MVNGAAPSRAANDPAEFTGCGMATHSRPPRASTRADSATASGIWSMSCTLRPGTRAAGGGGWVSHGSFHENH